jgi:uncharacterized Fe-S cluster protein YjdI
MCETESSEEKVGLAAYPLGRLLRRLMTERIDNAKLADLICDHSEKMKLINPMVFNEKQQKWELPKTKNCKFIPMNEELGAYLVAIVHKLIRHPRYKKYTPDWKEDMISRAFEHLTKYLWRNFDRARLISYTNRKGEVIKAKKDAVYSYVAQIAGNAFKQVADLYNKENELNDDYNDDYGIDYAELQEKAISAFNSVVPDETRLDYGGSIMD